MRHDDYLDADALNRQNAEKAAERDARWERIWQAAVAIHAAHCAVEPEYREHPEWSLDEAEDLVNQWQYLKEYRLAAVTEEGS